MSAAVEKHLDIAKIREDFPILDQRIRGKRLVYLDNAATAQKPKAVIETIRRFFSTDYSNIHRGVHVLSDRSTKAYEEARGKAQRFLNAAESREIVFVRGTTEAINLVAHSFGHKYVAKGDQILISEMEHHSNIVPWQILCEASGAQLRVIPINDRGELRMDEYQKMLNARTKLVAVTHVSNALGTVNPVQEIIAMAHHRGVPVLLDGAQAVPHTAVDVQALDCDFYAFSGHKLYGPTGIGVLYGKAKWLEAMPPYQGGGDMISSVTFEKTTYNKIPYKFEAGTPNIAGAIGLGAAIDYVQAAGLDRIAAHEHDLLRYAEEKIGRMPRVRLIGTAKDKAGILSFVLEDVHAHDVGTILDQEGIAIRTGHHCAQPVMKRFGIPATARASFAMYNSREEIDALAAGLDKVFEVFR